MDEKMTAQIVNDISNSLCAGVKQPAHSIAERIDIELSAVYFDPGPRHFRTSRHLRWSGFKRPVV